MLRHHRFQYTLRLYSFYCTLSNLNLNSLPAAYLHFFLSSSDIIHCLWLFQTCPTRLPDITVLRTLNGVVKEGFKMFSRSHPAEIVFILRILCRRNIASPQTFRCSWVALETGLGGYASFNRTIEVSLRQFGTLCNSLNEFGPIRNGSTSPGLQSHEYRLCELKVSL